MEKVAIYVRVSTQEQAREGYSIGEQVERLTLYCKAMHWKIADTYIDPGFSGGDTERPGLKALIKAVKDGGIDRVVVYKLDRLSRSQKDTLYLIEDVFLKNNTDFVSMSENFDTSTPFGRAMIGILAVFAQLEREQIKERMSMGKEARAKEGKWHGGSTPPIGYDYDEARDLLVVNEYEALQIREVVELFMKGTPLRTIERTFNEKGYKHKHGAWDPKTMRRLLRSKTLCGYNKYNEEYYKGEHVAIIDEKTHEKLVRMLDQRAEQYKLTGVKPGAPTTFLGGLLYCKHCGGKYTKQANGRKRPKTLWYMCSSRCKKVKKMIKDPNCKNKNWKVAELDQIVFDEIKKLTAYPGYIHEIKGERADTAEPNKIAIIEKEIEKLDAQVSRFMDLYGVGDFTMEQVADKVRPLNETRKNLQRELEQLNADAGRLTEAEAEEIAQSFAEVLEFGDFDEIRLAIETLIHYIEIDHDDIYIHWKFA